MSRSSKRNKRQSKPKASPQTPVAQPEQTYEPEQIVYEHDEPFADVEDFETGVADERQLQLLIKDWRKGRATRTVWDVLTDGYVLIFSVVVILAMIVSGIMSIQKSAAGCSTSGCINSRGLLPWLVLTLLLVIAINISRLFGPVVASAAEGFWLLDAPVDRRQLLGKRLWGVIIGSFCIGTILGGVIIMMTGLPWAVIGAWALGSGLAAAAVVALAAVEQAAERSVILSVVQSIIGLVAIAVLAAMIGLASGKLVLPLDPQHTKRAGLVILMVAAIAAVILAVLAGRKLNGIRRSRMVSGGDILSGMQGAAFALDFGLMRDIVVGRRWLNKGHVHSAAGRSSGRPALVWREMERLKRNPRALLVMLITALVPYALLSMGLGNLTPAIAAVVLMFAMVPFLDSLRVITRTRGLARSFPLSTSQLKGALTVIPGLLALIWALVTGPAFWIFGHEPFSPSAVWSSLLKAIVTAAAGYIGAIRWTSAKPADYSSPMVATGFGAAPPTLIFNLIRGFDLIALITLPALFGWHSWISIVLAGVCYQFLVSGGINTEDMMEQNAEAKRKLAEARGGGSNSSQKIRYTRSAKR